MPVAHPPKKAPSRAPPAQGSERTKHPTRRFRQTFRYRDGLTSSRLGPDSWGYDRVAWMEGFECRGMPITAVGMDTYGLIISDTALPT
jgi:hypothetical protein